MRGEMCVDKPIASGVLRNRTANVTRVKIVDLLRESRVTHNQCTLTAASRQWAALKLRRGFSPILISFYQAIFAGKNSANRSS